MTVHPLMRTHPLPDGRRARLRLPLRHDIPALRGLSDDATALRVLRFDPRRRLSVVAVVPGPSGEELVGAGTVDLQQGAEPVVLAGCDPEIAPVLRDALHEAAAA